MEADRYRAEYAHLNARGDGETRDGREIMCTLWARLMEAYIVPCAPREVNLPCPVRDRLLDQPCSSTPPHPAHLDEAVHIVHELMNDSVLVPFIESVAVPDSDTAMGDDLSGRRQSHRHSRSRMRSTHESSPARQDASRSPKFLPAVLGGRTSRSASTSTEAIDRAGLTDDSGSAGSPPAMEPMTPPMTPPTSEWAFATSPPGGLQRALNAHNNGWKRVGAKLGLGKKPRTGHHIRHQPTSGSGSSPVDGDISAGENTADNRL